MNDPGTVQAAVEQENHPLTPVSMEHVSVQMRETKVVACVAVNQPYGIRAAKFLSKNLQNNKHLILDFEQSFFKTGNPSGYSCARVLGSFNRFNLRHKVLRENMDLFVHTKALDCRALQTFNQPYREDFPYILHLAQKVRGMGLKPLSSLFFMMSSFPTRVMFHPLCAVVSPCLNMVKTSSVSSR